MSTTRGTTDVAAPPSGARHPFRRLAGSGLLAVLGAVALTTAAAALARAVGVDLEVATEPIPLSGDAFVTGVFSATGVVMALAFLRWSGRPHVWFVRTTVALTAVSLVPPVLVDADAATTVTLIGLHLVTAMVMIPALARVLRVRSVSSWGSWPTSRAEP